MLSVLLRYTNSDYPFSIFKLFLHLLQNPKFFLVKLAPLIKPTEVHSDKSDNVLVLTCRFPQTAFNIHPLRLRMLQTVALQISYFKLKSCEIFGFFSEFVR